MRKIQAHVDEEGRLVLPRAQPPVWTRTGSQVLIEEKATGLHLHTPVGHLKKVYIEPTNTCNLHCVTCVRNAWDEPLGLMESRTFARIIEGVKDFSPPPMVFFGGFGEPLSHPHIIDMVREARATGSRVELITNGTLLTPDRSKELIGAGLDMLWFPWTELLQKVILRSVWEQSSPKSSPTSPPSDRPAMVITFSLNRRLELSLWL